MKIFTWHPDAETLSGYSARTLTEDERLRIAGHLEQCTSCRETVKLLREVTVLENQSGDAAAPGDILSRIVESRAAGARTILPITDAVPVRSHRIALVAGLGIAALIAVAVISTRDVSAGSRTGSVRFEPTAPQPGQVVRVTYEPSSPLAPYDSLVLRARFRRPIDDAYNEGPVQCRVGVMRRSGSEFTLQFRLPDSVVFAVFAVESPAGNVVDDNDQQLWELVITDDAGRPLNEALVQKERDMMGRNWEGGLRATRARAALYPDDPEAAGMLVVFERWVLGDRIADSLLPRHRQRFAAMQAAYGEKTELSAPQVVGMAHFAIELDDSSASHFWISRLKKSYPNDFETLFREQSRLANQYHNRPRYFRELEPVWRRAELTRDRGLVLFAQNALMHAMVAKDTTQLRVWAGRYRGLRRDVTAADAYLGRELLKYPTLRDTAMAWLRHGARLLADAPDAYRELTVTVAEQQDINRARSQPILANLGQALAEEGNPGPGLDTLRLAASYGWNPRVLRSIAQTLMARGDTAAALQSYARVVADPGTPLAFKDSIRVLVPRASTANWPLLVDKAANEMRRQVLQRAEPRSLAGPLRLMTRSGEVQRLADVVNGKVTVVMFWSPYCGFSLQPLHDLDILSRRFTAQGAQVVTIVDQPFSKDLDQTLLVWKAGELRVLYDYRKDAQRAFTSFGTPNYFVLDPSGRVVFAHSSLEALPRQVAALLPEDTATP